MSGDRGKFNHYVINVLIFWLSMVWAFSSAQAQSQTPADPKVVITWNLDLTAFVGHTPEAEKFETWTSYQVFELEDGETAPLLRSVVNDFFESLGRNWVLSSSIDLLADLAHHWVTTEFPLDRGTMLPEASEVLREILYYRAAAWQMILSEDDWRASLASNSQSWTVQQKTRFLAEFGEILNSAYDPSGVEIFGRDDGKGLFGNSVLTTEELFSEMAEFEDAGVCRQHAHAMAQIAEDLGFQNVYVVSFLNVKTLHTTILMQNPESSGEVLKFDYAFMAESTLDEGQEILQQHSDAALNYYISRADGTPAAHLPTDLSLALADFTGHGRDVISVYSREKLPAVQSVRLNTGEASELLFLLGVRNNGQRFVAVIPSLQYGKGSEISRGTVSGGLIFRQLNGRNAQILDVYTRFTHELNSKWVGSEGIQGRAFSSSSLEAIGSAGRYSRKSGYGYSITPQGSLVSNMGLEGKISVEDGKTLIRVRGLRQFFVGVKDARGRFFPEIAENYSALQLQLTREWSEQLNAVAEVVIGTNEFGEQILIEGGVDHQSGDRIRARYQGRLNKEDLTLAPGMVRAYSLEGLKRLSSKFAVSGELILLDEESRSPVRLRFGGRFQP